MCTTCLPGKYYNVHVHMYMCTEGLPRQFKACTCTCTFAHGQYYMYMYMYVHCAYLHLHCTCALRGVYTWAVLGVLGAGGALPVGLVESFILFPFTMSARLEVLCSGGVGGGGGAAGTTEPPARGGKCAEEWSKAFWGGCR